MMSRLWAVSRSPLSAKKLKEKFMKQVSSRKKATVAFGAFSQIINVADMGMVTRGLKR